MKPQQRNDEHRRGDKGNGGGDRATARATARRPGGIAHARERRRRALIGDALPLKKLGERLIWPVVIHGISAML